VVDRKSSELKDIRNIMTVIDPPLGVVPGRPLPPEDRVGRPSTSTGSGKWGCLAVFVLLGLVIGIGLVHVHKKAAAAIAKEKKGDNRPVPVAVAKAIREDVPVELHLVGTVSAYSTVPVTAQVGGQLLKVLFKQGDYVRAGQPLFQIDPRPLEAALEQAEALLLKDRATILQDQAQMAKDLALVRQAQATHAKDMALVRQARSTLAKDQSSQVYAVDEDKRYRQLLKVGYATVEQAEQQRSNAQGFEGTISADAAAIQSAQATVDADSAAVQSARATVESDLAVMKSAQATVKSDLAGVSNATVQLGYTSIRSPLNGRTGTLNIYRGTVVKANDTTPLITIDEISPIYVSFAVPERYLAQIQRNQTVAPLPVTTELSDSSGNAETGHISFIENTVDNTTGTITMRATFANKSRVLWPGHYVNVVVKVSEEKQALLIPSPAVQPGQNGDSVFVVRPDNTVEDRPIKVKFTHGDMSVIESGLKAGETVVTDGQLQLAPNSTVKVGGRAGASKSESMDTPETIGKDQGDAESNGSATPDASETSGRHHHHHHRHVPPGAAQTSTPAPAGGPPGMR
jgi:multidrug efflux system membrane fusion protein